MGVGLIIMTEMLDPNELHAPDQYTPELRAVFMVDKAGQPLFYHPRCEVIRESIGTDTLEIRPRS